MVGGKRGVVLTCDGRLMFLVFMGRFLHLKRCLSLSEKSLFNDAASCTKR